MMVQMGHKLTHGAKDLRRIITNGVLSTPLLQQEDHEGNDEPNEIALAEKSFFQSKTFTSLPFFPNGGFNFSELTPHFGRIVGLPPQVCKVSNAFLDVTLGCEPTWRLLQWKVESLAKILNISSRRTNLDGKEAKTHYTSWDKLEPERNPPDVGAARHVKTDTNY
jgi:hypothetical protein